MKFSQKRINTIRTHFSSLDSGTEFVIVAPVAASNHKLLKKIGFNPPYSEGDAVLPAEVGPATRFNSKGRQITRHDLPMEERYITTIQWTWEQFAGRDRTETQYESRPIYKECYQRDTIPAPAAELKIARNEAGTFVVSELLVWDHSDDDRIQAIMNVFLELFGQCEIRTEDLERIAVPTVRKLNWRLLPPGKHPWSKVKRHLEESLKNKSERYSGPVIERQQKIVSLSPSSVFVGQGGFRDYIAYIFKDKQIAVLESIKPNNATYVFSKDWKTLSMLSKAEILDGGFQEDRIIHTKRWEQRVDQLFT